MTDDLSTTCSTTPSPTSSPTDRLAEIRARTADPARAPPGRGSTPPARRCSRPRRPWRRSRCSATTGRRSSPATTTHHVATTAGTTQLVAAYFVGDTPGGAAAVPGVRRGAGRRPAAGRARPASSGRPATPTTGPRGRPDVDSATSRSTSDGIDVELGAHDGRSMTDRLARPAGRLHAAGRRRASGCRCWFRREGERGERAVDADPGRRAQPGEHQRPGRGQRVRGTR